MKLMCSMTFRFASLLRESFREAFRSKLTCEIDVLYSNVGQSGEWQLKIFCEG